MVSVLLQTESHFPVTRNRIVDAVKDALARKVQSKTEVSIAIVGDRRMRQLNVTYRNTDAPADVLSFPLNDPTTASVPFASVPDGILRLGDIAVSYPQAVQRAQKENKMVDDVVISLVLHGLDHLLGIHHEE